MAGRKEYFLRRAQAFEDARPREGDFVGKSTPDDLRRADERCARIANYFRQRAAGLHPHPPEPDLT